ncbi:STAS domain-containing protein [Streptomyces xanthophaeus]
MLPEPWVGLAVAAVTGALDLHAVPKLTEHATDLLPDHPHLILDMSQVVSCDSSRLHTLLRPRRRGRRRPRPRRRTRQACD